MSLHDAYARITPYELAFPDRSVTQDFLARIDAEVSRSGTDPNDPHSFVTMDAVGAFVRGLEGPDAPPAAVHHLGALVYHGVQFTRADHPLYLLSTAAARYLVEGKPDGLPKPISPAGYLQLPQHLFWAEASDAAPQSVDGIFWTVVADRVLHTLIVTGLRPDRPGLDVVPLPEAPLEEAETWLAVDVRREGADFANALPGSDIDRLYSFQATGEILKLLARFFAYVGRTPSALCSSESAHADDGPAPSGLPFTRVTLDG